MFETILQKKIPVAQAIEFLTDWVTETFSTLFSLLQLLGNTLMEWMTTTLLFIHPLALIVFASGAIFFLTKKRWQLPSLTFIGLLFIYNQGLWEQMIYTLTLVLVASLISIVAGIPLGIWMAKSNRMKQLISPILDFMQTMPAFVYLIPAVAFFGIGMVPGVFASVIFALPPTVRFTNLAIREISTELIEASDAFGATPLQKLIKIELPLAKSTIMAGVNQTMMLALSMVVTGAMIGAPGLGREVLSALQKADIGNGFVSGVSLVILAIILDRITQIFNSQTREKSSAGKWVGLATLLLLALSSLGQVLTSQQSQGQTVRISYVQWDSEVASTHVIAQVLKDQGYAVQMIPLDNAVNWQTIASGNADFSTSAWLPVTHGEHLAKFQDQLDDLGPNLEGTKLGLVVPTYMTQINSIEDLSDQAQKTITGIEPGAGIMTAAQAAQTAYSNLADWSLTVASTGAMTTALDQAIQNEEDIIITGWSPHWIFSKYDLKYLEDPQGSFGDSETINTIARKDLEEDMPRVYQIIDRFSWSQADIEAVMLDINNGLSPEKAAQNWIEKHPETVAEWLAD